MSPRHSACTVQYRAVRTRTQRACRQGTKGVCVTHVCVCVGGGSSHTDLARTLPLNIFPYNHVCERKPG